MTTWQSKEWKDKRKERIENELCAQCGKTLALQVHHTYTDRNLYRIMERRIVKTLIKVKMDDGEIAFLGKQYQIFKCPSCQHKQKLSRLNQKTVTCKECQLKSNLTKHNTREVKEPNYNLGRTGVQLFIRRYRAEIDAELKGKQAPPKPDYMNLEQDTTVLCKVCHYALENGSDLCPKCKKNYRKIGNLMCRACSTQEQAKNE